MSSSKRYSTISVQQNSQVIAWRHGMVNYFEGRNGFTAANEKLCFEAKCKGFFFMNREWWSLTFLSFFKEQTKGYIFLFKWQEVRKFYLTFEMYINFLSNFSLNNPRNLLFRQLPTQFTTLSITYSMYRSLNNHSIHFINFPLL